MELELEARKAGLEDSEMLARMNLRLRADERMDDDLSDEEVRVRMKQMLAGTYVALIFTRDGETVGYTLTDTARKPFYLRHLFVEARFRRMGLGKRIVELTAQLLGATELDLEVMTWNTEARRFYEALGSRKRYLGLRYKI